MEPNYERAATLALEAPIMPLEILKNSPGVLVFTFAEVSNDTGIDRDEILNRFGENKDAATFQDPKGRYVVAYNQLLPLYIVQRTAARELGHILLGHDGSRPESVRMAETIFFAQHLLAPRPLLAAIQDAGVPITKNVLCNVTGSDDRCIACMKNAPGVRVSPKLNREIRDLFSGYISNFVSYKKEQRDDSPVVDLGSFLEGYSE